ncbi:MAG TPA: hypothetical protein VFS40_10175 [Gemmatimonadales bacterium]|nr:hypothetical protein [Gemmatimonadales bacterium]
MVFDYFFPGVLPGSVADVAPDAPARWTSTYVPAIAAALAGDPGRTAQLLAVTGAPIDPADPRTVVATAAGILWYSIFATPNATQVLGGQPFDNSGRAYAGSRDDAALNAGVGRFAASPPALAAIQATLTTTGRPTKPLVLLHTTGDPIVPVAQTRQYLATLRAAGLGDDRATAREVARYGHCAFTGPEVLDAFHALVERAGGAPGARRGATALVALE